MNYQTVHMNGTDMTVYENECMICMESDDDNGVKTVSVKSIPHLEIACKCDYLVHEACLQNWLTNNPACPICKQCLFYNIPQTSKKRKPSDCDTCGPSPVSRCLHRFLCCVTSPGSTRNA